MNNPRRKTVMTSGALAAVAALAVLMMGQVTTHPVQKGAPLAQQRVAAARLAYEQLVIEPHKLGEARASAEDTYLWSRRWMEAEQDAAADRPAALAAAEAHLVQMKELSQRIETQFRGGMVSDGQVAAAKFYLVDAEWSVAKCRTN